MKKERASALDWIAAISAVAAVVVSLLVFLRSVGLESQVATLQASLDRETARLQAALGDQLSTRSRVLEAVDRLTASYADVWSVLWRTDSKVWDEKADEISADAHRHIGEFLAAREALNYMIGNDLGTPSTCPQEGRKPAEGEDSPEEDGRPDEEEKYMYEVYLWRDHLGAAQKAVDDERPGTAGNKSPYIEHFRCLLEESLDRAQNFLDSTNPALALPSIHGTE